MNSTLYGKTEQHNQTVYYECFFFPHLRYQILGKKTPKMHAKYRIWRNEKTLQETCIMSF